MNDLKETKSLSGKIAEFQAALDKAQAEAVFMKSKKDKLVATLEPTILNLQLKGP